MVVLINGTKKMFRNLRTNVESVSPLEREYERTGRLPVEPIPEPYLDLKLNFDTMKMEAPKCDLEKALETSGKKLWVNGKYMGVIK